MTKQEYMSSFVRVYYDILLGLHSGIPGCCIIAYVCNHKRERDPRSVGYVRCSACISADKYVKIHKCSSACTDFLLSIGVRTVGLERALKRPGTDAGHQVSDRDVSWLLRAAYLDLIDGMKQEE